jgi:hypothetical protein
MKESSKESLKGIHFLGQSAIESLLLLWSHDSRASTLLSCLESRFLCSPDKLLFVGVHDGASDSRIGRRGANGTTAATATAAAAATAAATAAANVDWLLSRAHWRRCHDFLGLTQSVVHDKEESRRYEAGAVTVQCHTMANGLG